MKTCLALRHLPFEDLGLFGPLLARRGYRVRYVDVAVEALERQPALDADLVVVLGGPIGVYEADRYPFLGVELAHLGARLAADRPTLGICLGAQLIAAALGAKVAPGPRFELGWAPVELTEAGRASPLAAIEGRPVLHWHGDNLELPAGAVRLASTDACPVQAYALGTNVLGLQFHAEVDPARIELWLVGGAAGLAAAGAEPGELRAAARRHGAAMVELGPKLLDRWLDGLRG
jgi:GMP synthase (glutamine-hydrolysing)